MLAQTRPIFEFISTVELFENFACIYPHTGFLWPQFQYIDFEGLNNFAAYQWTTMPILPDYEKVKQLLGNHTNGSCYQVDGVQCCTKPSRLVSIV